MNKLFLILVLLISVYPAFAQTSQPDYREVLERAQILRNEADYLVKTLTPPSIGAANANPSIIDVINGLAATLQTLDATLAKAGKLIDRSNQSINTLEPEVVKTLNEVQLLTIDIRSQLDALSTVLRDEIQKSGESMRADVTLMREQLTKDLNTLFEAGVIQITRVGDQSYTVLATIDGQVKEIGTTLNGGIDELAAVLIREIGVQSATLKESLEALVNAGVESITKLTADTSAILVEIKQQVTSNGEQVKTSIDTLTTYVANLAAATTGFIAESTQTLRHAAGKPTTLVVG